MTKEQFEEYKFYLWRIKMVKRRNMELFGEPWPVSKLFSLEKIYIADTYDSSCISIAKIIPQLIQFVKPVYVPDLKRAFVFFDALSSMYAECHKAYWDAFWERDRVEKEGFAAYVKAAHEHLVQGPVGTPKSDGFLEYIRDSIAIYAERGEDEKAINLIPIYKREILLNL